MTSEAVTPDPGPLHAGFFVSVESRVNGDTGSRSPAQPGPGEDGGAQRAPLTRIAAPKPIGQGGRDKGKARHPCPREPVGGETRGSSPKGVGRAQHEKLNACMGISPVDKSSYPRETANATQVLDS